MGGNMLKTLLLQKIKPKIRCTALAIFRASYALTLFLKIVLSLSTFPFPVQFSQKNSKSICYDRSIRHLMILNYSTSVHRQSIS